MHGCVVLTIPADNSLSRCHWHQEAPEKTIWWAEPQLESNDKTKSVASSKSSAWYSPVQAIAQTLDTAAAQKSRGSSSTSQLSSDPLLIPGEFDDDEASDMLASVRAQKGTTWILSTQGTSIAKQVTKNVHTSFSPYPWLHCWNLLCADGY